MPNKSITFLSLEPLDFDKYNSKYPFDRVDGSHWVILGAETGKRKGKVIPKREWIENIVSECHKQNVPVFIKDSLVDIVGEKQMLREFPRQKGAKR